MAHAVAVDRKTAVAHFHLIEDLLIATRVRSSPTGPIDA